MAAILSKGDELISQQSSTYDVVARDIMRIRETYVYPTNTFMPRQNFGHFTDDIFQSNFLKEP